MGKSDESRARLEQAALELYRDRGYTEITAAAIAARAGLTERTFFRYFADKRDMLFSGGAAMESAAAEAIAKAEPMSALHLVLIGLHAVAPFFDDRPELVRERQRIIDAHADLQERELTKRAQFTAALGSALQQRGIDSRTAELTAAIGGVIFHAAFMRWLRGEAADLDSAISLSAESVAVLLSE